MVKIIFEDFQLTWSWYMSRMDRQMDRWLAIALLRSA